MLTEHVPKRKLLPTLDRAEPLIKDHTATAAFKQCPRKYFYRHVLGRVSMTQKNQQIFDWGSGIHKFCEVYSETGDFDLAWIKGMRIFSAPKPDSQNKFLTADRFSETCKKLRDFLDKEKAEGYTKVIANEQPWNVDLPHSVQTGGRFDQLIQLGSKLWPRDWKTTTKQPNMFATNLNPNDQAIRYTYAISRLQGWSSENPDPKLKAEGIIYPIIYNASSVGPKIEVHTVLFSNDQLIVWEREQIFLYKLMSICREQDEWPMHEGNCGWCDYVSICRAQTEKEMEYRLKNNFKYSPWNHMKVEQL